MASKKKPTQLAHEFAQRMYDKGYISKEADQLSAFVAKKLRSIELANSPRPPK